MYELCGGREDLAESREVVRQHLLKKVCNVRTYRNPSLISSDSPLYYNSHCARRARFAYFFLKKVRPPAEPMVFALMLGALIVGEVLDLDVLELKPEVFAEYRAELVAKASLLRFFIGCEADSLFLAGKLVYSVRKRAHIIPLL